MSFIRGPVLVHFLSLFNALLKLSAFFYLALFRASLLGVDRWGGSSSHKVYPPSGEAVFCLGYFLLLASQKFPFRTISRGFQLASRVLSVVLCFRRFWKGVRSGMVNLIAIYAQPGIRYQSWYSQRYLLSPGSLYCNDCYSWLTPIRRRIFWSN